MCWSPLQGQASPSEIMAEVVREIQPGRKTGSGEYWHVDDHSITVHVLPDGAGGGSSDSLLSIVTSQRERFKQRNSELDAVSPSLASCLILLVGPSGMSAAQADSHCPPEGSGLIARRQRQAV